MRASIAYAESTKRATSILDHRADLAADYLALADEVLARLPPLAEHGGRVLEFAIRDVHRPASSRSSAAVVTPLVPQGEAPGDAALRRPRIIQKYTEYTELDRA